jgi:hypothetical protein
MGIRRRAALALGSVALSLLTLSQPARADDHGRGRSPSARLADEAPEWQPAAEDELEPHHARSLVEMGAGLAAGSILYWLMMDRNIADWDNPTPEERFNGTAWRLDNNSLAVNFIAHPLMGGASYSFARANHHGPLVSFGYSFLTSFLWEFVLEFKEKVSVNDVLVTPVTGVPIGEFFYKLGLYLGSARQPSAGMQALRWSLGTGVTLDRALDDRAPPNVRQRDSLGLASSIWHHFDLGYRVAAVHSPSSPDYVRYDLSARGMLVTLPGYLAPKSFGRSFYGAELSDFAIGTEFSHHGSGMTMSSDTMIAGYHGQSMTGSALAPRGHAITIGASVAYSYLKSQANDYRAFREAVALPAPDLGYHTPKRAEQYSALHLPGPALDWHVRAPDVALSVAARAHPDFAGLGAPAFYDWSAAHREEKGKHILHRQGYFYGWGASGSLRASLRLGPVRFDAGIFHGRYWSQDGLDRHVESITVDVPAEGQVLFYSGSIGLKPPLLPLVLGADFGVRRFQTRVGGFERVGRISHQAFVASWAF